MPPFESGCSTDVLCEKMYLNGTAHFEQREARGLVSPHSPLPSIGDVRRWLRWPRPVRCVAPLCGCSVAGHFPACLFISYLKQPQPFTAALASSFFGGYSSNARRPPEAEYTTVYARFLVSAVSRTGSL